jgi:hypothetical protein
MIRIICPDCGGDNVSRDAFADWDFDTQAWVLGHVFDQGHCHDCGKEVSLDEEEVGVTRSPPGEGPPAVTITSSTTGDVHEGCGGVWRQDPECDLADICDKCGEGRA